MDPLSEILTARTATGTVDAPAGPTLGAASARAAGPPPATEAPASTDSQVTLSDEALEEDRAVPDFGAPDEAEGADKQEKLTPEKEIEQLRKQIEQLRAQLARQLEQGDEAGARATEARLGSLNRQLDGLLNANAGQAPADAVAPMGGGAPAGGGGGAPVGGGAPMGGGAPVGGGAPSGGGGGTATAGGPSTFGTSNAPPVDADALARTSPLGQKIAESGRRNCNGTGGYCFRHVGRALRENGIETSGASAYMAADQLARQTDKVREVQMDPKDFPKLPAGAIVVWDRGNGHEHGHISIADGKGGEYSDVYRRQITNYGTQPRVFLPADMKTNNR